MIFAGICLCRCVLALVGEREDPKFRFRDPKSQCIAFIPSLPVTTLLLTPPIPQALDAFLPENASDMCDLILAHVFHGRQPAKKGQKGRRDEDEGGDEEGDGPRWFAALQLMVIAASCMVWICVE